MKFGGVGVMVPAAARATVVGWARCARHATSLARPYHFGPVLLLVVCSSVESGKASGGDQYACAIYLPNHVQGLPGEVSASSVGFGKLVLSWCWASWWDRLQQSASSCMILFFPQLAQGQSGGRIPWDTSSVLGHNSTVCRVMGLFWPVPYQAGGDQAGGNQILILSHLQPRLVLCFLIWKDSLW
jgi:hypothetical protein